MDAVPEGFRIDPSFDGETARLALFGEVDAATAPLLEDTIARAVRGGCVEVVLQCEGLEFIDSSGLSVLVSTHQRLRSSGGELIIESPAPPARRLFGIAGLDRVLTIR